MRHHAVLIVAGDPLASALLGAAVEQAGCVPHFPQPGEAPRAALRRMRPRLVLVSCDHPEACSDAFIGPALMTGAAVLVIQTRDASSETRDVVERLDLTVVDLSTDTEALARCLRALDED
ncbi:MAG TPA: hypothetical protein VGG84_13895 [Gemmatimonadaceae bacterium]